MQIKFEIKESEEKHSKYFLDTMKCEDCGKYENEEDGEEENLFQEYAHANGSFVATCN